MKRPAGFAFFDFDNTLIQGDAGPLFGRFLVDERRRHMEDAHGIRVARLDHARVVARYIPYLTWVGVQAALYKARAVRRSRIVQSAYRGLKGIRAEHYYGLMDHFVHEELRPRIYADMVKAIEAHQAAGRRCVIVTTGAQELVRRALAYFPAGIELIGCRLEERNGRLTGRVTGPLYGADKANIVEAYCRATGVAPADCWAYSDHCSDVHMLEVVGHAVCVNPRGRLAHIARQRGWDVVRPRPQH